MTTLYAGVLTNRAQIHQGKEEPHFEILFRISYGMSKDQLGDFNSALGRPPFLTRKYNSHDCQVGVLQWGGIHTDIFCRGCLIGSLCAPA